MEATQPIELKITWTPGNPPQITGPISDRMLCYGLLQVMKDAVHDFHAEERRIATPTNFHLPAETGRLSRNGSDLAG